MADLTSGWQIKKEFTVGHIITTVTLLFSLLLWGWRVETRIAENERNIRAAKEISDVQYREINRRLERIEDKVDALK